MSYWQVAVLHIFFFIYIANILLQYTKWNEHYSAHKMKHLVHSRTLTTTSASILQQYNFQFPLISITTSSHVHVKVSYTTDVHVGIHVSKCEIYITHYHWKVDMKLLLPTVKTDAYSYNTLYLQLPLLLFFLYNFEMMVPLQNIEESKNGPQQVF